MNRGMAAILFLVAGICAYLFGVLGTLPKGAEEQVYYPFTALSSATVLLFGGAVVFFMGALALMLSGKKLPGDRDELARRYKAASKPIRNRVWELGLLTNGLLAAAAFAGLFAITLNGGSGLFLGAFLILIAVQIVTSLLLVFFFVVKKEKSIPLFLPGLGLFLVETACVVLVIIFGM